MSVYWRISLFGGLSVQQGDTILTRFRTQKTASLLAYLAFHSGQVFSREVLIDMLWPDSDGAAGRMNLRTSLASLRRQLEGPAIPAQALFTASTLTIQMNASAFNTDVREFEDFCANAGRATSIAERTQRLLQAADLFGGGLLPGFYEDWIRPQQQRLEDLFFGAVRTLLPLLCQQKEEVRALEIARHAVAMDPRQEDIQKVLLHLLITQGEVAQARQRLSDLRRFYHAEYGEALPPSLEGIERIIKAYRGNPADARPVSGVSSVLSPGEPRPLGTVTLISAERSPNGPISSTFSAANSAGIPPWLQSMPSYLLENTNIRWVAAFGRATDAVQAVQAFCAMRDSPDASSWRIALVTGEAAPDEPVYAGSIRIEARTLLVAAHPGQVLCSETTALLIRSRLSDSHFSCRDLGLWRLGDTVSARVFQLDAGTPRDFPSLSARTHLASNLSFPTTRFFGRESERAYLQARLMPAREISGASASQPSRLIALTGPGGIGKTRLALTVASSLLEAYYDAVWFVPLAVITDPSLLPDTVLQTLRVARLPHMSALDQILETLRQHPALIVLDNAEHLLDACASLVRQLLERLPFLTCLVTSRQRLLLAAEQEFVVGPLPVSGGATTPEQLIQSPSAHLFVDRAQMIVPDFQVTLGNVQAVAELCDRLEGIPLAIEMAASRAKLVTPRQMLDQLTHRFDFLSNRRRDAMHRHQTLRATLDWSMQLLPGRLQLLFAELSVFRGGWTLEAASAVLAQPITFDDLNLLVEASLVITFEAQTVKRFRMLETMREYGLGCLTHGRLTELEHAYLQHFVAVAEQTHFLGSDQAPWVQRLEADLDNIRGALGWAYENGETETGLYLATKLFRFWDFGMHLREGLRWIERGLNGADEVSEHLRGIALNNAGSLAILMGDFPHAMSLHEAALALYRRSNDALGIASLLTNMGQNLAGHGELDRAETMLEEALPIWQDREDRWCAAVSLTGLSTIKFWRDDYKAARQMIQEALELWEAIQETTYVDEAHIRLGLIAARQGLHEESRRHLFLALQHLQTQATGGRVASCIEAIAESVVLADPEACAARALTLLSAAVRLREGDSSRSYRIDEENC